MNNQKSNVEQFFTPGNFYNLQAAGISVWIICLVIGSIFTDLSSFSFRIFAISFSFIISLSLFIKNKYWRKSYNYILIIVNAALVFVNASGYNSITYSYAFENTRLQQRQPNKNNFLNFQNQVLWWPDYKLINKTDSLLSKTQECERINSDLYNQIAFIKDWVNTTITDQKSKDTLNSLLKNVGQYQIDSSDYLFLKFNRQKQIDSLELELRLRPEIRSGYLVNGKYISATDYVENLLKENQILLDSLTKYKNQIPKSNAGTNQILTLPNQEQNDTTHL